MTRYERTFIGFLQYMIDREFVKELVKIDSFESEEHKLMISRRVAFEVAEKVIPMIQDKSYSEALEMFDEIMSQDERDSL